MITSEHLDINVTEHCNNRCVSCSHASPFSPPWFYPADTLKRDLDNIGKVIRFDFIALLGGEPLLHPDLETLIAITRKANCRTIKVVTNGWLIPRMTDSFWKAMTGLQIEWCIYPNMPNETRDQTHDFLTRKCREFGVFPTEIYKDKFSYALHKPDKGETFYSCWLKVMCMTVHDGKVFLCPQSRVFPHRFLGMERGCEGVDLEGITDESFARFLVRETPLSSCSICAAYTIEHPHAQAQSQEEWLTKSTL